MQDCSPHRHKVVYIHAHTMCITTFMKQMHAYTKFHKRVCNCSVLENMYISLHTYAYTYAYIYVYIYIAVDANARDSERDIQKYMERDRKGYRERDMGNN